MAISKAYRWDKNLKIVVLLRINQRQRKLFKALASKRRCLNGQWSGWIYATTSSPFSESYLYLVSRRQWFFCWEISGLSRWSTPELTDQSQIQRPEVIARNKAMDENKSESWLGKHRVYPSMRDMESLQKVCCRAPGKGNRCQRCRHSLWDQGVRLFLLFVDWRTCSLASSQALWPKSDIRNMDWRSKKPICAGSY